MRPHVAEAAKAVVVVELPESYEACERGMGLRALGELLGRAMAIGEREADAEAHGGIS